MIVAGRLNASVGRASMTQAHDWGCTAAFVNLGTEYDLQEGATGCSFTCMYECVHKYYLYICVCLFFMYVVMYLCLEPQCRLSASVIT